MTGPKHPSLAAALVAFQAELPTVGKDKTANMGTYSYKYADLGTITHEVFPLLTKHGLAFVCGGHATENGYELRATLIHESGEELSGSLPLYGRDPQQIGSAVTYARRYLLGSMTGVCTEDDDDGKRAVKAERTPVKDWDIIADTAESLTDVDALKSLWTREHVSKAPKVIQDRIKAHGALLKKEAGE